MARKGRETRTKEQNNKGRRRTRKNGGGSWGTTSDRRLKKELLPLNDALGELLKLRGLTFEYIEEGHGLPGRNTGFIAQEVEKVIPEWVETDPETDIKSMHVTGFEARVVEALRTLNERNEYLQRIQAEKDAEIAALQKRLALLEGLAGRLASIEAQLGVPAAAGEEQK